MNTRLSTFHGARLITRWGSLFGSTCVPALGILVTLSTLPVHGDDWPQWRHDPHRSAATMHSCPDELVLQWTKDLGTPDPAYDHQYRMCADAANSPVAAKGIVFIPSNTENSVTACDLKTGQTRWQCVTEGPVRFAPVYHQRRVYFGSDDGYLSVIDGKLAVPSGRSLAAWFDLETGKMEPYTCFYVKLNPLRGTWYLSGIGQYWVQGGNWFGTRGDSLPQVPADLREAKTGLSGSRNRPEHELAAAKNRPFFRAPKYALHNENLYPEPILTATTIYASEFDSPQKYLVPRGHTRVSYPEFDKIVARDLTQAMWKEVPERLRLYPPGTKIRRLEFPVLWQLSTPLRAMLKAGDRLYAGGAGRVAAIAIPQRGEEPQVVWQADVNGNPVAALVASGCLIVSTDTGQLYCFGGEAGEQTPSRSMQTMVATDAHPPRTPAQGYALCLGEDAGQHARALAASNQYHVIHYRPGMSLAPYWANHVHVSSLESFGPAARQFLHLALDCLRPYTGKMELPGDAFHRDLVNEFVDQKDGYELRLASDRCLVHRATAPPLSGQWTHEAGGPENTFAGTDQLVKWPLAVLWNSGDIDRYFTPASHFQHERNPYPLVTQGRMFIITHESLHAIDIYTGRYLWKVEMPLTDKVQARYKDSRIYGRPIDRNYVATDDSVYVVLEQEIHVYSAADGSKTRVITIPAAVRQEVVHPQWTEVRVHGETLLSVVGNRLVAIDRNTDKLLWQRTSKLGATTFAIADDRVIGLDCVGTRVGGAGRQRNVRGTMFVLDRRSGDTIWSREVEFESVSAHTVEHPRPWLLPAHPVLAYNSKHQLIVLTARRNCVQVYRAADGSLLWKKSGGGTNIQRIYAPLVTEDHLVLSQYQGYFGYVLDILSRDR